MRSERDRSELLALCRACTRGETQARERFLEAYLDTICEAIERVQADENFVREVSRELLETLFRARRPAILGYNDREPLRAWLRIEATRAAFGRLRALEMPLAHAKA